MKITKIKISGFRGIPPVEPPDIDVRLVDSGGEPQNLLVFGPNAFGKSSIADALEWFFKECARGSHYFDGYQDRDNVHLNLGKPNYPTTAYVELEILHGNQLHTVRKELDDTGHKTVESLSSLAPDLGECRDEIIVLDHDQFREFVRAANKDKWATFSSLIGYEELDRFRAGLESLFGKSLTDSLQFSALEKSLNAKRQKWENEIKDAFTTFSLNPSDEPLPTLCKELVGRLGLVLTSLGMETPQDAAAIDEALWVDLRTRTKPSDAYQQATERIDRLDALAEKASPFEKPFLEAIPNLLKRVAALEKKKEHFDKEVLADFYAGGLQVMEQGKAEPDRCPFCKTPFPWDDLSRLVSERLAALDLQAIQQESITLTRQWQDLNRQAKAKAQSAAGSDLTEVQEAINGLMDDAKSQGALAIASFDADQVRQWAGACQILATSLQAASTKIAHDRRSIETAMGTNPLAELESKVQDCFSLWLTWQSLNDSWKDLVAMQRQVDVTKQVVEKVRAASGKYREELGDFSGRVVDLINEDVKRYYDALHPADGVQPFLETEVLGNQRKVLLKCAYRGSECKDAASLLSESHRNSLGLAILLAFRKYKRRSGSPVDFIVFDDVTQSFDVGHRLNLIKFLEDSSYPEVAQSQVIFLTHDRTLADLMQRPGETRENWLRYDIRSLQLNNMKIEPSDVDLLQRARDHLARGDEIAAAIYGRHALEQTYKSIVESASVLMPYNPKPWQTNLAEYETWIIETVKRLWLEKIQKGSKTFHLGLINPEDIKLEEIRRAVRALHLTVHESDFLDNPPSSLEIETAIDAVAKLRDVFTCPSCRAGAKPAYRFFHTLSRDKQGNPPKCKSCKQPPVATTP